MQISRFSSFLKFLDQPQLMRRLGDSVTWSLPAVGGAYTVLDVARAPEGQKQKILVRDVSVLAGTMGLGFIANKRWLRAEYLEKFEEWLLGNKEEGLKGLKAFFKEAQDLPASVRKTIEKVLPTAAKPAGTILSPNEVHQLRQDLLSAFPKNPKRAETIFDHIIPAPESGTKTFKDIMADIGKLSLIGLFPVLGGIGGGVVGNLINGDNWKQRLKDQTKEGFYQYTANIVLCNVGAAAMILLLTGLAKIAPNKAWKQFLEGRNARLIAMSSGILAVGVLGGSVIANVMGNNYVNPLFDKGPHAAWHSLKDKVKQHGVKSLFKDIYKERHFVPSDVFLHIDDFATVGFLAGLRWVGAILMFLYSFSGFRAGTGYRNGDVSPFVKPSVEPVSVSVKAEKPAIPKADQSPHTHFDGNLPTNATPWRYTAAMSPSYPAGFYNPTFSPYTAPAVFSRFFA